ncbi:MAG: tyrosine--tRNA ligase [Verrucomicrobiota bacterium]
MATPEEQLDLLTRGLTEIHSAEALLAKLKSGQPLRIKFGVDPTSPDLHFGHTVPLLKLRQFQDLGHQAVLIIGDFTARIGDPTGKNSTRPMLSMDEIRANAKTYEDQAFSILNRDQTEVVWNGTWFDQMTLMDTMKLLAQKTVAQTLQRRDFKERMEKGQDVMMHELQYPIMQGWDSVMVKSDVELGGSDQLFNLLTGRELQEKEGQKPQVVMTLPILEGTDGVEKMSKSLNNYIGVREDPETMFGKVMSISDELMKKYYLLLLGEELDASAHPMESKKSLASRLVDRFHGKGSGQIARDQFELRFSKKSLAEADLEEHQVSENPIWICKLLQESGVVKSSGDARRLVQQGAVKINEEKFSDPKGNLAVETGMILQAGKKFFRKLVD